MAPWTCGIDFGTSFTTVACHPDDDGPRLVELDPNAREDARFQLPSIVYVDDDRFVVGRAAERRGRERPGRLVRSPKLALGTGYDRDQDGVWDVVDGDDDIVVPVPELCGAIVAEAYRRACEREGSRPRHVRVTYPAAWTAAAQRVRAMRRVLAHADLAHADLVTEPDAAARALFLDDSLEPLRDGAAAVVYDLGGGTCDVAVMRASAAGPVDLCARGCDDVGGEEFDRRLAGHVIAEVAATRPEAWGLAPDSDRMDDPVWRVAAAKLLEDIVVAKHELSSEDETDVLVRWPGDRDGAEVPLTRDTLDRVVDEPLDRTVQTLLDGLRASAVEPGDVDTTYLTGGSSRIPRVASVLRGVLGGEVVPAPRPKDVVAIGATLDWPGPGNVRPRIIYDPDRSPFDLHESGPTAEVRRWRS
jgi:molecular chaperone DnaK (HSP70)